MRPQNLALDVPAVRRYLAELQKRIVGKLVHAPKSSNLARRIWPAVK